MTTIRVGKAPARALHSMPKLCISYMRVARLDKPKGMIQKALTLAMVFWPTAILTMMGCGLIAIPKITAMINPSRKFRRLSDCLVLTNRFAGMYESLDHRRGITLVEITLGVEGDHAPVFDRRAGNIDVLVDPTVMHLSGNFSQTARDYAHVPRTIFRDLWRVD